jgi:ABC-type dipeptide/oligopeptide/nickel transport system permease subunit
VLCVAVAVARMVVGVGLGLLAGWFRGITERVVDAISSVGITLPVLVTALAAIFLLGVERGLVSFLVALTLFGWVDIANLVKTQTQTVAQAPYIESACALGVRPLGLVRRHLLPQLRPLLPVLFAFELSAVLLLVTELGFLGVYIGGGVTYAVMSPGLVDFQRLTAEYPELGQQIARFWSKFYIVPWEFLIVGALIFVQIVGFNLLGEGLRRKLDVTRPRRARWWQRWGVPQAALDRVPTLGWRWAATGLVAAVAVGAWMFVRVLPATTDQLAIARMDVPAVSDQPASAEQLAAVESPAVSDQPAPAEQLAAVDLEAILNQPGMLPDQYSILQVATRVPDLFRRVPKPDTTFSISVNRAGLYDGTVTALLYADAATRDEAERTMLDAVIRRSGFSGGPPEKVFVRCGAVVHVQLGAGQQEFGMSGQVEQRLASFIQRIDAQLAPLVCQG